MARADSLAQAIQKTLEAQRGVIFGRPAIVGRSMYTGRDIIAPNSRFAPGYTDERGYVPVEWWIMSLTEAGNDIPKPGEGVTRLLLLGGEEVPLTSAQKACAELLFGPYADRWPLAKVLDIGGEPAVPSYGGEAEVPPIPFHTHAGEIVHGRVRPPGKLEAYFFPPVDIPPYRKELGRVITRLGLKPGTTQEQVRAAIERFGESDEMYALGAAYEIRPYEGWTIPPGTLHAPGPWPTFEIQYPQDDFNFCAWRLGKRAKGQELARLKRELCLRGLKDAGDFLAQAVDWETSTDPRFKERFYRPSRELESGAWGRRLQIFFDEFYGEAVEIEPGRTYTLQAEARPFAGIVWSGQGLLNGQPIADISGGAPVEFLVTPGCDARFENAGSITLRVYTVYPLKRAPRPSSAGESSGVSKPIHR